MRKNKIIYLLLISATMSLMGCKLSYGQNSTKEHFGEFMTFFTSDTAFQLTRIKFPLVFITPSDYRERLDTSYIEKKKWKHDDLMFQGRMYRIQYFYSFNFDTPDTDERVVDVVGTYDGYDKRYYFKRINSLWYLIKVEDISI